MNRDEKIQEIKQRLDHMNDNELSKVHKMTRPETEADIVANIKKHSQQIRPDTVRRF